LFIENVEVAMAKLSITVNKIRCIGSGDCVETAPAVFQLDAEGKSEVVNATGAGDSIIVAAARSCPVKAITVMDEAGVQLFPPLKK
jgi:ferredoxin